MTITLLHLLYQLPAMFVLGPAIRNVLPTELDTKLIPVFLILSCLAVLYMPLTLTLAVACVWPVMVLHRAFGVNLDKVVPFEVPEFLKTLPRPRRTQHIIYDAAHEVTDYDAQDMTTDLPAEAETTRKSFIPPLP